MMLLGKTTLTGYHNTGAYVAGEWVASSATSFTFDASPQPLSSWDMQLIPEGRRDRAGYKLYTDTLLQNSDEDAGTNADTVVINGETFEVLSCEPWQFPSMLLMHYKAVVVRL